MTPLSNIPSTWDVETDVVVVGYGYAGAVSAIESHDLGSRTVILEKMPHAGGISICSGGGSRIASNAESAFSYLKATCNGTTPDTVLRAFAEGMTGIKDRMADFARVSGGRLDYIEYPGNYPFEGFRDLGFVMIGEIPGFEPTRYYPKVRGLRGGARHFKVMEDNVALRKIPVWLETAVERLVQAPDGRVIGVIARRQGQRVTIHASQGVILACGGFEAAEDLKRQYLQGTTILSAAVRGNTGDGIRMAQSAGAALWHMWHYHGTYGFRHPDGKYPFGIRPWRLPDWNPEYPAPRSMEMPWIVVDKLGRRYMNEYPPYLHDMGHRPMEHYDPVRLEFPRIPSTLIYDEDSRKLHPMGIPAFNDSEAFYEWSADNLKEVDLGILKRADSIEDLAAQIHVPLEELRATIVRWNRACEEGKDMDYGRPAQSLRKIAKPPYYFGSVWPVVSNTQGGPVHDEHWRVLNAYGEAIPGLYEAGELGGIFGFLYLAGGNLAECYIGGQRAAQHAARNQHMRAAKLHAVSGGA